MKQLVTEDVTKGLHDQPAPVVRSPLPVFRRATGIPSLHLTNGEMQDLFDEEDLERARAKRYWEEDRQVVFCRITVLGLVRLLMNRNLVRSGPFTCGQSWGACREFLGLPEVGFIHEPAGIENHMATRGKTPGIPHTLWTDAYVAAVATGAGCRMVSLDGDFARFPGVNFLHLKG